MALLKVKSLQVRLTLYIFVLLLTGLCSMIGVVIVDFRAQAVKQMKEYSTGYLQMLSYSISPAIEFDDMEAVKEIAALLSRVKEFQSVAIILPNGKIFYSQSFKEERNTGKREKSFAIEVSIVNEVSEPLGTLQAKITTQYVLAQIKKDSIDVILIGLLVLIFSIIFTVYLSKRFLAPLLSLKKHIDEMSAQGFTGRVLISRRDEIGALAESFNKMSESLEHTTVSRDELVEEVQERRKAEEALLSEKEFSDILINSLPGVFYLIDRSGKIVKWNDNFELVAGYSHEEFAVLNSALDVIANPDKEMIAGKIKSVLETGRFEIAEADLLTKTGETVSYYFTGVRIVKNDIAYLVGLGIDITERKKGEEDRLQLEKDLSNSRKLEAMGTLAAGIAHEINTPIQFINDNVLFLAESIESLLKAIETYRAGLAETASGGNIADAVTAGKSVEEEIDFTYLKEEIPKAIEQTGDGIKRVSKIVNAMKDFSHVGSNEKEMADINKAIDSTVTISRNEWKYVSDVELELDPELPFVRCFLHDVNQVIMNLIVNAAHAIGDVVGNEGREKGRIVITTKRKNDRAILITVADTGKGIPENIQSKIFEPFFTTKEVGKGTGQGLAIAYATIVEKHKGVLWVESEMGKGSTFYIELPIDSEEMTGA